MTRPVKFILGIIVAFTVFATATLVLGGFAIARGADTEPGKVSLATSKIADLNIPENFRESFTVNIAGWSAAIYNRTDGCCHLTLAQAPEGTAVAIDNVDEGFFNNVQLDNGQNNGARYDRGYRDRMRIVRRKLVTIRGEQSVLTVREGQSSRGYSYKEATILFHAKNGGQAMLALSSPSASFDGAELDSLIASIK